MKGPIEDQLEPPLRDEQLQRVARKVQAARHADPRRAARPLLVGAVLAGLGIVAVLSWSMQPTPIAPLAAASGDVLPATLTGVVAFSDGSQLALDDGTRADVVANQAGRLTLVLREGHARFEVNPASHRQWVIETGVASVEVLGTIFTVDRRPEGVRVGVERGVVLVRSERLPDRVQRLEAGMSVFAPALIAAVPPRAPEATVDTPAIAPPSTGPEARREAVLAQPSVRPPRAEPVAVATPHPTPATPAEWQPVAKRGEFERAWALLEPSFSERLGHADAAELVLMADTARATGRHAEAALALTRALELSPGDATVAFTLARLELDVLRRPDEAARHFELVATATPASPLRYDAMVRRVEALQAAKELPAALAAARQALVDFPSGAHTERLERLVRALESSAP